MKPDKKRASRVASKGLREALPYVREFVGKTFVIKIGGASMKNGASQDSLAKGIVLLKMVGINVILIHGGGDAVSDAMRDRGMIPTFVGGKRVTDEPTLLIVREVLAGRVNQDVTNLVTSNGADAIGINGVSMNLFDVIPADNAAELGFVGKIVSVHVEKLKSLLNDFIPVIAPIGTGLGRIFNINGDDVASAVASALQAEKLIYICDTPGVQREKTTIPFLDESSAIAMIFNGQITGGMVPKLHSGYAALRNGVSKVHLIDGTEEDSLLMEIFTDTGVGTELVLRPI
ncbi:MAG: acetylglutamate kinase [Candidatus Moranbacteria bacterium]|nr:acetylglutamate kinase [Candidatus Moranbacteria bacterium]